MDLFVEKMAENGLFLDEIGSRSVTKTEEVKDSFLRAFENGEDFRPILEKYKRSKSVLYEGMALAFRESLHQFEGVQEEAGCLREEIRDLNERRDD